MAPISQIRQIGEKVPARVKFVLARLGVFGAALVVLFAIQRHGSGSIGRIFGPIMLLWFSAIAALGNGRQAHLRCSRHVLPAGV